MPIEQLLIVASMWAVATVSPGPNFLTIAQLAASQPRAVALSAVAGTGIATLVWGVSGVAGVQTLFAVAPWAFVALKIAGAAYLIYIGSRLVVRSFRKQRTEADLVAPTRPLTIRRGMVIGVVTGLANPRSALSVASVFAVAMPANPPITMAAAAVATMLIVSVGWYLVVALLFASPFMVRAYARIGHWIDRLAGGLLAFLGVRLALETR